MHKIFCVIPAYNEEKTIKKVIEDVMPLVDKVIVVDDGSADRTFVLASLTGAAVLRHIVNRGQGAALKTGTEFALKNQADFIIHFDADDQFIASDINKIIKPLIADQADIVFGSRFLGNSDQSNIPAFKRKIIIPLAKLINRLLFSINLTDPQNGFRAMTRKTALKLDWQQERMAHCSEILFETVNQGFRYKEISVAVVYHNFGQKISGGVKILKDLFLAKLLN